MMGNTAKIYENYHLL